VASLAASHHLSTHPQFRIDFHLFVVAVTQYGKMIANPRRIFEPNLLIIITTKGTNTEAKESKREVCEARSRETREARNCRQQKESKAEVPDINWVGRYVHHYGQRCLASR
jgi:hypothetical protein